MAQKEEKVNPLLDNIMENIINPSIDKEIVRKMYDAWAETYDQDIGDTPGGRARYACEIVDELFNKDYSIKILDAGAGTGLVGELLHKEGYKNLDALDASSQMLEKARNKNVYNRLICDYLGPNKLDIDNGTYDLVISLGSLLSTHINEEAFEEMIRITKPGGFIVFLVAMAAIGEAKSPIEASMQKLDDAGKWEWKVSRILENYINFSELHPTQGLIYVFKTKDM